MSFSLMCIRYKRDNGGNIQELWNPMPAFHVLFRYYFSVKDAVIWKNTLITHLRE